MTWLALLAFVKRIGSGVVKWLSSLSFWQLACLGLALFAGLQTIRVSAERRHSAKVEAQIVKCEAARHADREAYAKAQADAQAKNRADVERTKQQQKEISDATVANLNARLERLRRELSASAAQGAPGHPGLSENGNPAPRADGQAGVCLTPEELLRAAENEERHDRLIDWVERQSKVDPNKVLEPAQ